MCLKHVKRFPTPDSWRILQPTGRFLRCSKSSLQNLSIPRIWDEPEQERLLSHGEHVFLMRANKIYTRPRWEVISRCAWYYSRRFCCLYMHPSTCFCGGGGGSLPESIISLTSFHSDTDNMTARTALRSLSQQERQSECMRQCCARRRARQRLIPCSGRIIR